MRAPARERRERPYSATAAPPSSIPKCDDGSRFEILAGGPPRIGMIASVFIVSVFIVSALEVFCSFRCRPMVCDVLGDGGVPVIATPPANSQHIFAAALLDCFLWHLN